MAALPRSPTLPLLAFQHHVGPLHINPAQLEFLVELSSSSDLAIVELARLALLPSGKTTRAVVKVFRPFVVATPADFRELLLEASMLHRLAHPHIVRFYGLGCFRHGSLAEVRESMFMVEEYVGSRTLRKLLSEQGRCRVKNLYDMRAALRWAAQVASALCALHELSPSYVHNDVKADNVFLTDGRTGAAVAKLGDLKPHRHVYDREPSTLSHHQQQQRAQLAKQGRQSSLARYSLERISGGSNASGGGGGASGSIPACRLPSIGAGRLLRASGGSDDTGSSPAAVSNISSSSGGGVGQHHHQLPPPSVLLPAGGHGSCWTAAEDGSWSSCGAAALVAAADADADAAPVARLRSLPVPIGSSRSGHMARSGSCNEEWGSATYGTAASACASTASIEVGSASSSFFSASSHGCRSRGGSSSLSAAGSGSLAGLSDVLSPASAPPYGNSLAAEIARADAAAAAVQAEAAGGDESAAAAAADGAAEGTGSPGGGAEGRGIAFRRLRNKTLRLSDSASSTGDGGDGAAAAAHAKSRVMSLSAATGNGDPAAPATAELGSEAVGVQDCVETNSPAVAPAAGALAVAMGKQQQAPKAAACSGGLPFLQGLLHKHRANSTDALGDAAGGAPLHGARSAPTAMFGADDAALEGAVHDGSLLALQPAKSAPASALAALQQPQPQQQELRRHIAARLLKQQGVQQQAVPPAAYGGWELSPSGAANPCGSAQCSMLDLFADLTDEEAATSRRYRDSSQYTLVPGSFVQHKVVPSPRLASVQSAPAVSGSSGRTAGGNSGSSSSWDVAAASAPGSKWLSSAASADACGSPSQQEQQLLLAMQQLERAQAAICKGSAPSAIESKQHGGSSAFAALTAIDCITEESSSVATDSCAPSRESTAHGGGHFYEDVAGAPKDQAQLQQQPTAGSLQSLLSASSLQKALSLSALTRRVSSGSAVVDGDAGGSCGSLAEGRGSPRAVTAAGAPAADSRAIQSTGAGCTPPASPLAQHAAGREDSFGSDTSPAAAGGEGVGSPFAVCSDAAAAGATTPAPAAGRSPAAKRVRFALERPEGATASRDYSLLYAAPELMRGERPTEKVDVFAFGVVLLELLSRTLVVNHCAEVCSAAAGTSSKRGSRHAKDASSACAPPAEDGAGVAASAHSSSHDSSAADGDAGAPHEQQVLLAYAQAVASGARPRLPPHFPERVAVLIRACWAAEPHERPRMCDVLSELQAWSKDRHLVAALDDFVLGLADLGISHAQPGCSCIIS